MNEIREKGALVLENRGTIEKERTHIDRFSTTYGSSSRVEVSALKQVSFRRDRFREDVSNTQRSVSNALIVASPEYFFLLRY